jgi:hypothetical protein
MTVNVFTDVNALMRFSNDYFKRQVPFAAAMAINATAAKVVAAQNADILKELDQPTPFTQKTFRLISKASKGRLTAIIDAGTAQAHYLSPVATGGVQVVNKSDTLRAVALAKNSYGNLPRNVISKLKSDPNVFIGTIKFRDGNEVSGVWRRPARGDQRAGGRGTKGKLRVISGARTGLQLLLAFNKPTNVREKLHAERIVAAIVGANFSIEMRRQLARAIVTAR